MEYDPRFNQKVNRNIEIAAQVAELNASYKQWKLGSVIVNKSVLAIGSNKYMNDPKNVPVEKCGIHAEVNALNQVPWGKSIGSSIYTARYTPGGKISLARSCNRCFEALRLAGVKHVYYTISNGIIGHERISDFGLFDTSQRNYQRDIVM